jgi:hypothetical protein
MNMAYLIFGPGGDPAPDCFLYNRVMSKLPRLVEFAVFEGVAGHMIFQSPSEGRGAAVRRLSDVSGRMPPSRSCQCRIVRADRVFLPTYPNLPTGG